MSEENTKVMILYKVIAQGGKNSGDPMECSRCGKVFNYNLSEGTVGVQCHLCTMGLADGVVVEIHKQRMLRVKSKEIDKKVDRRLTDGK